jgi:hypothetical protein
LAVFIDTFLTIKKQKMGLFILTNLHKKPYKLAFYEVLFKKWCKKYTIDNFTYNQYVSGNVPGKITVIYTFYNHEKNIFLRVFAFWAKFFVNRTANNSV